MLEQSFTATEISAFDDNGVPGVAFGEVAGEETRHYLLLLRSKPNGKPDEAEVLFAEWDEQTNTCINGIEKIALNPNRLQLVFSADAGIVNSEDGQPLMQLTVQFQTDAETLQNLEASLRQITNGLCNYRGI